MPYIQAIDPGYINLAISTFYISKHGTFKLKSLENKNIKNFRDIIKLLKDDLYQLVIESQPKSSKLYSLQFYLEGYCLAKNIKFSKFKACKGETYKDRKINSIELLKERDPEIYNNVIKIFNPKIDDIADCYNIGYNALIYPKYNKFSYIKYGKCLISNYKNNTDIIIHRENPNNNFLLNKV